MKIYTKTGDNGTTGLIDGTRLLKYSLRVDAYGTVDELNSVIGIITTMDVPEELLENLNKLKNILFELGSDLANPMTSEHDTKAIRIKSDYIFWLEILIDKYSEQIPKLTNFIIPGGSPVAAYLNNARTVARRAERLVVELAGKENIGNNIVIFLNRLSDYLFVAARYANFKTGISENIWKIED